MITTRVVGAFAPGALRSADTSRGTPYHVLALQTAMNEKSGYPKYIHIHRFGISHETRPVCADGAELVEWMGGVPFQASPELLDALGPGALSAAHRYVFFRLGKG